MTSLSSALSDSSSLSAGAVADTQRARESASSLSDHVKVVDYPNLQQRLLETPHYRAAIALPGEPLDSATLTDHSINIKPNATPVYISAYGLPHSQRESVNDLIKDMLEQGVIQHPRSPRNSPLSLVLKRGLNFQTYH